MGMFHGFDDKVKSLSMKCRNGRASMTLHARGELDMCPPRYLVAGGCARSYSQWEQTCKNAFNALASP